MESSSLTSRILFVYCLLFLPKPTADHGVLLFIYCQWIVCKKTVNRRCRDYCVISCEHSSFSLTTQKRQDSLGSTESFLWMKCEPIIDEPLAFRPLVPVLDIIKRTKRSNATVVLPKLYFRIWLLTGYSRPQLTCDHFVEYSNSCLLFRMPFQNADPDGLPNEFLYLSN